MMSQIEKILKQDASAYFLDLAKKQVPFKKSICIDGESFSFGKHATTCIDEMGSILEIFSCIYHNHAPSEPPRLLDLGSGSGTIVLYGSNLGFYAYGIEYDLIQCKLAMENVVAAKQAAFVKRDAVICQGNFFPKGFEVKRNPTSPDIQKSRRPGSLFEGKLVDDADLFADCIPENDGMDPYAQMNILPCAFDVFYHYQMERRDNLLRFFSEYAKSGSFFVINKVFNDSFSLPRNVQFLGNRKRVFVYQKLDFSQSF